MKHFNMSYIKKICVILLFSINKEKIATALCPEILSPVLKICENGEMRNSQIYVDGSTAANVTATECKCTILLHDGGQVLWLQYNGPGFGECGANLQISSTQQTFTFECQGGLVFMDTLPAASTINLTLHKPAEQIDPFTTNYCYRISETTSGHDLTVRCCDPSDQVCAVVNDVTEPTPKPVTSQKPEVPTQQQTTAKPVTTQQQTTAEHVTTRKTQVTKTTGEPQKGNVTTNEGKSSTPNTDDTTEESSPHSDKQHDSENGDKIPVEIAVPVVVIAILFCVATVVGAVIYVRRGRTSIKDQTYDRHVTVVGRDDHQYEDMGQRSDYVIPS